MSKDQVDDFLQRIESLEAELELARNTLNSLIEGTSDAIILQDADGHSQVYTIHRANESFVAILDALPEGAVIVDAEGTILYCNRILANWLQSDTQSLISRTLTDFLIMPQELSFPELLPQTTKKKTRRELKLKSGDAFIPVQFSCTLLSGNGGKQFGVILSDLSEQKRVQELATSSHLAILLLNQVKEAIMIFDETGKIIIHSRLASELFKQDLYQLDISKILKNFNLISEADKKTQHSQRLDFQSILQKSFFINLTGKYWDPSGNVFFDCNVTAQPLLDETGNVIGGLVKVIDITESLQRQVDQLLFYSISHLSTQFRNLKKFSFAVCKKLSELYDIHDIIIKLPDEFGKGNEIIHYSVSQLYDSAKMETLLDKVKAENLGDTDVIIQYRDTKMGNWLTFIHVEVGSRGRMLVGLSWPAYLNARKEPIAENRLLVFREELGLAMERVLTQREQQLHSLVLSDSPYGIILLNQKYEIVWANRAAQSALPEIDWSKSVLPDLSRFLKTKQETILEEIFENLKKDEPWAGEVAWEDSKGQTKYFDVVFHLVEHDDEMGAAQILMMFKDITDSKVLEQQLFQAQKMEAIGKLAGGVAHDFNNLLTVINGYSDLLLQSLPENSETFKNVAQIRRAGEKAGRLTSQLLAFSRRQVVQPKILNINQVIQDTEKMLRRLIGEDIVLETELAKSLKNVKLDPGQLDQIILNLAVNARDAMPNGGVLKIKTMNRELGMVYAAKRELVKPGEYVLLQMSDTGIGMSKDVMEKIFEPFFTTKEKGKGTGLGLSTVYGIVKQHNGYIWVYSEQGLGTTFKIYFPAIASQTGPVETTQKTTEDLTGSDTILLVEDDQWVRKFTALSLEAYGYRVLEAADGREALKMFEENPDIGIVVTDLVMPHMGGQELGRLLLQKSGNINIIYMSGYTEDAMLKYGIIKKGVNFIQKPFSGIELVRKIKEVKEKSE